MVAGRAVERLVRLAAAGPGSVARYDWPAVERSLGLRLPSDYKQVVDTFPDGKFKELVKVVRPASDDDYLGYYATQLEDMRGYRVSGDGEFADPIFPEAGGLLPWGFGPRGELFFWLTRDEDPDRWPVVWADTYFCDWFRYDMTMSEFLLRLVEDPPPEIGEIARTDPAGSPPFRAFGSPATAGRSAPEIALAETLEAMHEAVPARRNEIAELLDHLPARPGGRPPTDWPALEVRLGVPLPADYKTFLDAHGPGAFNDLIMLGAEPSGPYGMLRVLEGLRALIAQARMSMIVTAFPEPRGVLPWGYAPDGRIYGWRVAGRDPETWGVVLIAPNFVVVDHLDLSFSSFLLTYSGLRDRTGLSEYDRPASL